MTQSELTAIATEIALANLYDITALDSWLKRVRALQALNPNRNEAATICRRANRAYDYAEVKELAARKELR